MEEIDSGKLRPVYLLHGEEYYFLESLLKKIQEKAVDPGTAGFNHHQFYGKDTDVMNLLNTARRYPMMAERQLVILKEAQELKTADEIIPYLNSPLESTVLVWYHPGKKLPMNRKIGAAFKPHKIFAADSLREQEVPDIVREYVKKKGFDIEPSSLQLLLDYNSSRLSQIIRELDKVFANLDPGSKIRENHIQDFVGINKEYNLFSLQAALAKRDVPKSMEILSHVKNNMTLNPLPLVLATFFSFFRKVAILHSLRGQTDKEMMAALGIQFYFLSEYKFAARSFNPQQIERIVEIIHHADLRFKGIMESSGSEANLLEETIVRILNVN